MIKYKTKQDLPEEPLFRWCGYCKGYKYIKHLEFMHHLNICEKEKAKERDK